MDGAACGRIVPVPKEIPEPVPSGGDRDGAGGRRPGLVPPAAGPGTAGRGVALSTSTTLPAKATRISTRSAVAAGISSWEVSQ